MPVRCIDLTYVRAYPPGGRFTSRRPYRLASVTWYQTEWVVRYEPSKRGTQMKSFETQREAVKAAKEWCK